MAFRIESIFFVVFAVFFACKETGETLVIDTRFIGEDGKQRYAAKRLDPSKTAIIVVDMWQHGGHGYINPDGTFTGTNEGYFYQNHVCDSINETLSAARSLGFVIVHAPSGQTYLYEGHPARSNVVTLPIADYPWVEKPGLPDHNPVPYNDYGYEYEYAYPHSKKENNRPGTKTYGQNPRIVIADSDYITDDIEELWNLIAYRNIETLIYMGGASNMCLSGRPFGVLNMLAYQMDILVDRNYAHLVHRIPHGWNGDIDNPQYGPFFTNERNSRKVISYFEKHLCPTIDGMVLRELANLKGGYEVSQPSLYEGVYDPSHIKVSFQTQLIEVPDGYLTDIGWQFGDNPNGLTYGWNRLKVKDALRDHFNPLTGSYLSCKKGDSWRMELPKDQLFDIRLKASGNGEISAGGVAHGVRSEEAEELAFRAAERVDLQVLTGEVKFYEISCKRVEGI